MIATCPPGEAARLIAGTPGCQLIDVREWPEFAGGHVAGARLMPLGGLLSAADILDKTRPVIILCKGGKRAATAAQLLESDGFTSLMVVDGGTDAWIASGLPVTREARAPWALERQVRLVAGILVLAGLFIPPWPYLSLMVGAGLTVAALTNTCAMGMLLSKMPWNRRRADGTVPSCCTK